MGIESDRLVYDYLSRVGDAAQQQHLSSGDRMRLVSTLRNEIDRQRGKYATDSPAAVRRILGRLGEPAALVSAAAGTDGAGQDAAGAAPTAPVRPVPEQRSRPKSLGIKGLMGAIGAKGGNGGNGGNGGKRSSGTSGGAGTVAEPAGPMVPVPPAASAPPVSPVSPTPVSPAPRVSPASPVTPASPDEAPELSEASEPPAAAPAPAPAPEPPSESTELPAAFRSSGSLSLDKPSVPSPTRPDWWRIEAGPLSEPVRSAGYGEDLGDGHGTGFVGGIEIPEILDAPPKKDSESGAEKEREEREGRKEHEGRKARKVRKGRKGQVLAETAVTAEAVEAAEAAEAVEAVPGQASGTDGAGRSRRRLPRLLPGRRADKPAMGLSNPLLMLAAALLVAGAFLGSWLALGGGWLLAYASRTLSRAEAKWAVFGLPGVAAAGGLVWIWGRLDQRWGEAIPKDGMADALTGVWPVVLRTAAVSSALYLVWRARRKRVPR